MDWGSEMSYSALKGNSLDDILKASTTPKLSKIMPVAQFTVKKIRKIFWTFFCNRTKKLLSNGESKGKEKILNLWEFFT